MITKQLLRVSFRAHRRAVIAGSALVCAATFSPGRVATAPQTGRIAGRVTITAAVPTPLAAASYSSRRVERTPAASTNELGNVVIFVQDPPPGTTVAAGHARIAQEGESFSPRVAAITRGSIVDFPNGDPFFHDVFSLSRAATFDLGSYPRGSSRSQAFPRAGLVKVYCHIHSHMSASILVFDHSFFTMPRPDGSFTIDGLPAGRYEVRAWHERIGENIQGVRVEPGRVAEIEFSLPVATR